MDNNKNRNELTDVYNLNDPSHTRSSADLLPAYLQTDKNKKFLSSTIDRLIEVPRVERISGYVGTKNTPTYNPKKDQYISSVSPLTQKYQLEPGLIIRDEKNNIVESLAYDDLINQLAYFNGTVDNHDKILRPITYSYHPHFDIDKFVNYTQYYWLEGGPDSIEITGLQKATVSTLSVTDNIDATIFVFTPDGITPDPVLTFYRGLTYVLNVDSVHNLYIKTALSYGQADQYNGALNNGANSGQIIITIDDQTPTTLFYVAGDDTTVAGKIVVKSLLENTTLDVEKEIIGKINYRSGNDVELSNGMLITFPDNIFPETYAGKRWLVEGVGTYITLVDFDSLQNNVDASNNLDTNFDAQNFDQYPFDDFRNAPITPDYIVINRASVDKNPWTRYNRWFHAGVIEASAKANNVAPLFPQDKRAQRPIIEFQANIKLYNFGYNAQPNVDLIDTTTRDAFTAVEGSSGYYIDGVLLEEGYRVIFNADTDSLIRGKTFVVKFETVNGNQIINLMEDLSVNLSAGNSIVSTKGTEHRGNSWWWDGKAWNLAQQRHGVNQAPLFDLFDDMGISYSDLTHYQGSFTGTKIFGYTEGTIYDPVLKLNLKYLNVANIGDFLFTNYFNTDTFTIATATATTTVDVSSGFLKISNGITTTYENVWTKTENTAIPVIQYNVLDTASRTIDINAIDYPGWQSDLSVSVYLNDVKKTVNVDYRLTAENQYLFVVFNNTLSIGDRVLIKLFTLAPANNNGYYEPSLGLTNNPLNGPISQLTLAEFTDQLKSIADIVPNFSGVPLGSNNLRDLGSVNQYGTRLISHVDPLSFAHFFVGLKQHNVINAVRKVADDYQSFKNVFIKSVSEFTNALTPRDAVDQILSTINAGKDIVFPYGYSDMLAYGQDYIARNYTVTDKRITTYSLPILIDTIKTSDQCVIAYLNGRQLLLGTDYTLPTNDTSITFLIALSLNDLIELRCYASTEGCYVPPTPTKLGLYPKFIPTSYVDSSYSVPSKVIEGHDGSITQAFNDYRDDIILELEKRIYNNIKSSTVYRTSLLDINSVLPGAYRPKEFSYKEIFKILTPDFLKWTGFNGVDYQSNTYSLDNSKTWNYRTGAKNLTNNLVLPGHWRGIFKYFYDTDRPHTHAWEMLGYSEQPEWWFNQYGNAPFTSGNLVLWQDLAQGLIKDPANIRIDPTYARPNLLDIIPVDEYGNLVMPDVNGLATDIIQSQLGEPWQFGDHSPAETAWRRSSMWPFAVQVLLTLTKPAKYCSMLFDTSRIKLSVAGQTVYGSKLQLLKLSDLVLYRDIVNGVRHTASGYSVMLIEAGLQRNLNYISHLKADLSGADYNLIYKAEGFLDKDKLAIRIDSVDPTSVNPGVLLPAEDFSINLTQSNPIISLSVSGLIIQKNQGAYTVKGYDNFKPYFTILKPIHSFRDEGITVGGVSENFVTWKEYKFYQTGQIVSYNGKYYRTVHSHTATASFNSDNFQSLPSLPMLGGITVARAVQYETTPTTLAYGIKLLTIQDVYDFILGYGQYLESQGFIFDYFQSDLNSILNWNFTAQEFLFWASQNWIDGSLLVLSPFAQQIKFSNTNSLGTTYGVVDDITDPFYQYTLLTADGTAFPPKQYTLSREENQFVLETLLPSTGFYFAQVNLIQKQHAVIFNNFSMFNDIVYDVETGYRQNRVKLTGFRTAEWNGGFTSPGFVYDEAVVNDWQPFVDYAPADLVRYSGRYYSAIMKVDGSETFNFADWQVLRSKPMPGLLPNFEYKITQFEDFYSLDIDNFDTAQQKMAQHLTGYTPRIYLDNIFDDRISQYKFYQGYIKEKGTANAITKLAKASLNNLQGRVEFLETWAFRIGAFGGYNTYQELQINLDTQKFIQNPQVVEFTDFYKTSNDFIYRIPQSDLLVAPTDYDSTQVFPKLDTTYTDYISDIQTAGYVRIDDITGTAYNINSILDIGSPNSIPEGSTFWLGFRADGEWDVLRYTRQNIQIIQCTIENPGTSIRFTTAQSHNLTVGEVIAVSRFIPELNKVYIVTAVVSGTEFIVASSLSAIPFSSEVYIGLISKFISVRFKSFDDLHALPRLTTTIYGDKIWVDDDGTGKWAVYEKINNYKDSIFYDHVDNTNQLYGFNYSTDESTSTYVVSAPGFFDSNYGYGKVFVYNKQSQRTVDANTVFTYSLKESGHDYYLSTVPPEFGYSLKYDAADDIVFVGAPGTSNVRGDLTGTGDLRFVNDSNNIIPQNGIGMIKITAIKRDTTQPITLAVLTTPHPTANGRYGNSLVVNSTATNKQFLVGAPGEGVGHVYNYSMTMGRYNTSTVSITALPAITAPVGLETGALFGQSIAANNNLSIVAVGAPGHITATGAVYIYTATNSTYTLAQTISASTAGISNLINSGDRLGNKVVISKDASYMFISSPGTQYGLYQGMVSVWTWNGSFYVWLQNLTQPNRNSNTVFGFDISIDDSNENLVVSSLGTLELQNITFDKYTGLLANAQVTFGSKYVKDPASVERNKKTTFDSNSTRFYSDIEGAGSVSIFNRYNKYFSYAQDIQSNSVTANSDFGYSVAQLGGNVYVGAPTANTDVGANNGETFIFQKINANVKSWSLLRYEEPLVDPTGIKRIMTIDTDKDTISQHLEIFDPVKGFIPGSANQELTYKTMTDPAIYSVGGSANSVDTTKNWLDDHIGQLWWDTGAVKYYWYEQGELEYRKNQWGTTFPGSAIQVYEWVSSKLLPSEWAAVADTADGLLQGISGQPKYADNSVLSVKQVYNSISNTFSNVYYYWVRNKTTIPTTVTGRRMSALSVAGLIADPKNQSLQYAAILSPSAIAVANVKDLIKNKKTNLHINIDFSKNSAPRHTEWLLLQEGDTFSTPSVMLERKMIDSLVGFDAVGNPVPDPALSVQQRYGINIRPRQTMFVNRYGALRTLLEWTNGILLANRIISVNSIPNLQKMEEIPPANSNLYDQIVETNYQLSEIITRGFSQATLACTIDSNGRIDRVTVTYSGSSYSPSSPPTVTVQGNGVGAVIQTVVNQLGQVIDAYVVNGGTGFTTVPKLLVRPYTVYVLTDSEANNMWSKFEWSQKELQWIRVHSQQYDVTKYWTTVDWTSTDYNKLQPIVYTISDTYGLEGIRPATGEYVKVQNGGAGRYIILRKVDKTVKVGTFDADYDIIYEEKGTIQLSNTLWDTQATDYAFDEIAGYDQTFFDQAPDAELGYVITAIRDDLFVGNLKMYWNKFFFHAVKYALSEQINVDWVFKTAFINAINYAGSLDQRSTYKLQDSKYYLDWIEEVKPYHTQVRNFTANYTSIDSTRTFNTDFDLPAYYDQATNNFVSIQTLTNTVLQTYPYKSWLDNYAYEVGEIQVNDGGYNYVNPPRVKIITAPGDTGSGATAVAYISLGKVYKVVVTNPGSNYKITPTVVLVGGGGKDYRQATARVQLYNGRVRSTQVTIKFDRISYGSELPSVNATDYFTADGEAYTWVLTWVPQAEKNTIKLTIDGSTVLTDKYTIEYYSDFFTNPNGLTYLKDYAKLVLNFVPTINQNIKIDYVKNVKILSAIDRINNYYEPAAGMPGKDPEQLMKGLSFGGVRVDTLPFNYASGWDVLPYYTSAWDSYSSESNYGVVRDPQLAVPDELTKTQADIANANDQLTFWQTRFNQLSAQLAQTPTLIQVPGTGLQYVNNPEYQYLAGQVGEAQNQVSSYNALIASLTHIVNEISANYVPVSTPFVVPNGAVINVYVSTTTAAIAGGNATRIDPTAVPTIFGTGTTATVYIPSNLFDPTLTGQLVTFRDQTNDGTILPGDPDALDVVISGGDLSEITLGIKPSDILLDGAGFLDSNYSYAPEEMLPGQVQESIGISVFESKAQASPLIFNKKYFLDQITSTFNIGGKPASTASVLVTIGTTPLRYAVDYTVNSVANTINLLSNTWTGWLSVSGLSVGGTGLVDSQVVVDSNTTATIINSGAALSEIRDAYVTVNGQETKSFVIGAAPGYGSRKNPKGSITVYHDRFGSKQIQVWLFNSPAKAYSQVHEQIFSNVNHLNSTFFLTQPPSTALPHEPQMIVEYNKKRLVPPQVSYYVVENDQYEFTVDLNDPLLPGQIDLTNVKVYRNGIELNPGYEFSFTPPPVKVIFPAGSTSNGDVLAIMSLVGNQYAFDGGQQILSIQNIPDRQDTDTLRVITFSNDSGVFINPNLQTLRDNTKQEGMFRKERYSANPAGRYVMSRPTADSNYVWVEYNGQPLQSDLDYAIEEDKVTVRLRKDIFTTATDKVVVMSLNDDSYGNINSYRMFTDLVGRTSYKTLDKNSITHLAQPLLSTDTVIYVDDVSVFTPPNVQKNLPGIVYIAGERIEFFLINSTLRTLGQLRRGTLGTGILDGLPRGTAVIDQGPNQNIPVIETTTVENFVTTASQTIFVLTATSFVNTAPLTDQVEIRVNGQLQLKPTNAGMYSTDLSIAYDSGQENSLGISNLTTITSYYTITNQIINSTSTPVLLWTAGSLPAGYHVSVSQRKGVIFENTPAIGFINERQGILPTDAYYPGDPIIILETGAVLTDESQVPLEGI